MMVLQDQHSEVLRVIFRPSTRTQCRCQKETASERNAPKLQKHASSLNFVCSTTGGPIFLKSSMFQSAQTERNDPMEKLLLNREPLLTPAAVSRWLGVPPRTVCLWAE